MSDLNDPDEHLAILAADRRRAINDRCLLRRRVVGIICLCISASMLSFVAFCSLLEKKSVQLQPPTYPGRPQPPQDFDPVAWKFTNQEPPRVTHSPSLPAP